MGAPVPKLNPAEDATADALLSSLRTIAAAERRKHASVFNYWLAIRGDREFPPIRDLDPLEISDAGPFSLLLEMVGGGEDAEIRHFGQAIKGGIEAAKVSEAPGASLLACIATRLPVIAACREAFAFEDQFEGADGKTRCWVTLLPFSATGTWIDFVYGFVSLDPGPDGVESVPDVAQDAALAEAVEALEPEEASEPEPESEPLELEPAAEAPEPESEPESEPQPLELEPELEPEPVAEAVEPEPELETEPDAGPGLAARLSKTLGSLGGFYGQPVEVELDMNSAALEILEPNTPDPAKEPAEQLASAEPNSTQEESLQSKLADVRAKADEARQAKLRANTALYEGLSAVYDFALDAEDAPEEYLKLVEAQGLKIQLRSPMQPVVKLAFHGLCDDSTIDQLESVLAWALKQNLPRGVLAERIEAEGGIAAIVDGKAA